ncbi:DNA-binding protein [Amycolatopsis antarctica]|uniref:DNA-binding protein n=1 Tax=Amycolatopsis antarctica TaxID=1854586 RepID=A0A263D0B6_9PSEU|nr:cold shock domain-containing protein [Amycolatopsis antarctica]OZM71873.1 DNA-binding protein [Amycolatopsis antarctica]
MTTGEVLRFDDTRGFGFIAPDDGGEDVFVHANDLLDDKNSVRPGARVSFDVEDGNRGLKATSVRVLDDPRGGSRAPARPARPARDGDEPGDVLDTDEYQHELTEVLLDGVPSLTAAQIVQIRQRLVIVARDHGWVVS